MKNSVNIFMRLAWMAFVMLSPLVTFTQTLDKVANLPYALEEASGMEYVLGFGLFMLEDTKKPFIYRVCEKSGEIKQVIKIKDSQFKDKESLTADEQFLYIGDIGDNKGKRKSLQIIKLPLSELTLTSDTISITGETITVEIYNKKKPSKKKQNIYDFEALIVQSDSIYLFSKRRKDHKTVVYSFSNESGDQIAFPKCIFDTNGLITGAALNKQTNELVLIGYQKRKKNPFLIYFSNFDFCSTTTNSKRIELLEDDLSIQVESITFYKNKQLLFSNEWTKDKSQGIFSYPLILSE